MNLFDKSFKSFSNFSSVILSISLLNLVNSTFIFFSNFSENSFLLSSSSNKLLFKKSLIYESANFWVNFLTFFKKSGFFLFSSLYLFISFINLFINSLLFLIHSFFIIYFQLFSITGILPLLIESKILWTNSTNIAPVNILFLNLFGFVFFITLFLNIFDCSKNSFLNWLSGKFCKFCKSCSFSIGLTITKQSLSGKYVLINALTRFFSSIVFDNPLNSSSAFSKYCFSVITLPFLSSNFKLKSLKSQSNVGKYWANSSSLSSIDTLFIFIVLLKFNTKLKLFIWFSSIAPNELYTNKELINIAIRNILLSWLISSS